MFASRLSNLTLASGLVEAMFPNIRCDDFNGDQTFLATVRALLPSRLPEGEEFLETLVSVGIDSLEDPQQLFFRDAEHHGIRICNLSGISQETAEAVFRRLREPGGLPAGVREMEDVSLFLSQKGVLSLVAVDEARRVAWVFAEGLNTAKWHLVQSLLPRLLPWYFRDHPLSKAELDLLLSLTRRTPDAYQVAVEELSKQYDIRSLRIRDGLAGFEARFEKQELENLSQEIAQRDADLEALRNRFAQRLRERENLVIRESGLREKIRRAQEPGASELMDYFLCNQSLHFLSVDGTKLRFVVSGYLDNYDPDAFESIADNPDSYFYYKGSDHYDNPEMTHERTEKLLRAIFQDGRIKVHTCAAFDLDAGSFHVSALRNFSYPPEFSGCLPNPHLHYHSCLGSNELEILDALRRRDYILAVEACVAAARNMNFTDSTVGEELMESLHSEHAGLWLELPDGTRVTPMDAILWLEEQEETESGKETEHE